MPVLLSFWAWDDAAQAQRGRQATSKRLQGFFVSSSLHGVQHSRQHLSNGEQ